MSNSVGAGDKGESKAPAAPSHPRAKAAGGAWELDILGMIWRTFTSVRVALILILLIALAVLANTVIMQAPPSAISDPERYEFWLEGARAKYGGFLTDILDFLQFFDVDHAIWFRVLIALLSVSILVCSLDRWKGIWSAVFHTPVRMGDAFFDQAPFNARVEAVMPATVAAQRVQRALARSRYRVKTEADDDSVAVCADRNRFSRFGTFFSHLSIVLLLAGWVIGRLWGVSDPQFIVAEGSTDELGLGSNISVKLEHVIDEYYLDGRPKDYYSELVIYDEAVEVKRGTARVNSPLGYEGFKFHQSGFGPAAAMEVRDKDGTLLFSEGVPLAWSGDGIRPYGDFALDIDGDQYEEMRVVVVGPMSGEDPVIPAGEVFVQVFRESEDTGTSTFVAEGPLAQGKPGELADLEITFQREQRFTLLRVVKDPGLNLVWTAGTLLVLGLVMLFYFPHRRVWALCRPRPDGKADVRLGAMAQRDLALAQEFRRLHRRVRLALGILDEEDEDSQGGGTSHA